MAFAIHKEDTAYTPSCTAITAADRQVAQAEQVEVVPTYSTHDFFNLNKKFTEAQTKAHSKILNEHEDPRYNAVNALVMDLILNNCHPDMLCKITIQLEAVDEDQCGGALALFYIHHAVVRTSQENSGTIKSALKKFRIRDTPRRICDTCMVHVNIVFNVGV